MHERLIGINRIEPADFIRKYAEANKDWPYSELVTYLYPKVEEVKRRFFDGVFKPWDLTRLPSPPVAIENMGNYLHLASYRLVPDGYGFNDKLTLNQVHFIKGENGNWVWDYGGEWGLWESVTHELAHEYCVRKGIARDHGKPFTDKLLSLGIHCDNRGVHTAIADADPNKGFGKLMQEWLIKRPEEIIVEPTIRALPWWLIDKGERKGVSTLSKWTCGCQNVRVGTKSFAAQCLKCGNVFAPVDKRVIPVEKKDGKRTS